MQIRSETYQYNLSAALYTLSKQFCFFYVRVVTMPASRSCLLANVFLCFLLTLKIRLLFLHQQLNVFQYFYIFNQCKSLYFLNIYSLSEGLQADILLVTRVLYLKLRILDRSEYIQPQSHTTIHHILESYSKQSSTKIKT